QRIIEGHRVAAWLGHRPSQRVRGGSRRRRRLGNLVRWKIVRPGDIAGRGARRGIRDGQRGSVFLYRIRGRATHSSTGEGARVHGTPTEMVGGRPCGSPSRGAAKATVERAGGLPLLLIGRLAGEGAEGKDIPMSED